MDMDAKKIKLKQNKPDGSLVSPDFSISFKQSVSEKENRQNSYDILSVLKGNNDVVIEANSSLFNLPASQRESSAMDFLDTIRALGLDYRYRKTASSSAPSFLSQLFGMNKNSSAHEILAYVPHSVWKTEDFCKAIPVFGARYYITDGPAESSKLLDDMSKMLDEEKRDFFKLIVFDASSFSYMGVYTKRLTYEDIKQLLRI